MASAPADTAGNARIVVVAILLWVVSIAPVFWTQTLPLVDYPNHVARLHILLNVSRSPELQQFFIPNWHLLPSLAFDAFGEIIGQIVTADVAAKMFIALSMALIAIGVLSLQWALFGRLTAFPLIAFLFMNSWILMVGLLNYYFATGVFLLTLSAWIGCRGRPWWQRLVVFNLATALLFCSHLLMVGVYGISVVAMEAAALPGRLRSAPAHAVRELAVASGQFLFPAALFVAYQLSMPGLPDAASEEPVYKPGYPLSRLVQATIFIWSYDRPLDLVTAALIVAVLIALALSGRATIDRRMWTVIACLCATYLLIPDHVLSGTLVPQRLPFIVALVGLAATAWTGRGAGLQRLALVGVLALFAVRQTVIVLNWHGFDQQAASYLRMFDLMPKGSRLTGAVADEGDDTWIRRPLWHFGCHVTTLRDGFYYTIFAIPRQQPLALKEPFRSLQRRYQWDSFDSRMLAQSYLRAHPDPFNADYLRNFDYFLVFRPEKFVLDWPAGLVPVFNADGVTLYRIDPTQLR